MNSANWDNLKNSFNKAINLPADERAAFLENFDDELQSQLKALIEAHEEAGEFILEPAMVEIGLADEIDRNIGRRIDAYEILEEIGKGGMGAVYLAKHSGESFSQRVALKLIKRGMDTTSVLKRFVMERQILANLEHPNIARLLDVGTTQDGLPYFVMEYIEGLPVTKFCDAHKFSIEERLKLLRQICAAVQYAHQNLVVHRDIKPSNILVTEDGTPKLLDFGIAKLLNPDWSLETNEATATMMRLLTPEYASPEQLRGLNITTASDVYSLGVVLYELLSGRRPFRIEDDSREEFIQAILTEEPVKPSSVVSNQWSVNSKDTNRNEQQTINDRQRINSKSQIVNPKSLRGDLDNIILKALRKDPTRRYTSAQELSEDIRRHLEGLPVTAIADTASYRFAKFVKRHRIGVLASGLVVLILLSATAITGWQAVIARREQAKAEMRFNQVRKLANTVLFEYHDGVAKLAGSTPMREKMVKDALEYLDNLSSESGNNADLQRELAAAYQKVGDVQGGNSQSNLGNRDDAIKSYRKSLAILQSVTNSTPDNSLFVEIAAVHGKLYQLLWKMSQQNEAEEHLYQALTIREQLVASEPNNLIYQLALARGYRDFGGMLASKTERNSEGAIAYYRKSNDLCDSIVKTDPSNLEARAIAGLGYRMLGAEFELNEPQQAMEYYQKALALTQEREKLDSQNAQIQIVLADCYSNIGRALIMKGDGEGALENFNLSMRIFKSRLAEDPNDALLKMNLSQTYNNIGNALAQDDKFPEALANYRQALDLREAYIKDHPNESGFQFRLGETTFDLGDLYTKIANGNETSAKNKAISWREAKSWYQRSLEVWQTLSKNGTLPGYQVAKPDETLKAISRCDTALAQLSVK